MCGRYYIDDGTADEIEALLQELSGDAEGKAAGSPVRLPRITGDIYPDGRAAVLIKTPSGIGADIKRWGFRSWDGKGLVINARAETAATKSMFRESVRCRRCIIPASGFYEWNREKEKFTFTLPGNRPMFFAGLYRWFQEGGEGRENQENRADRYVILTTGANASVEPVHPRMPLILGWEEVTRWLEDDSAVERLLAGEPEGLKRGAEYEQMRLSFPE